MIKVHENTAVVWKDEKISYTQLLINIAYYAKLYRGQSIKKIAVFSENRPEWIYGFYSAWKNKCIAVPIDFMSTSDEVAYILNDCKPEVIFYSDATSSVLEEAVQKLGLEIININFDAVSLPEEQENDIQLPETDKNETAVLIYTSGTTGSPKGVMLSFDNLLANIEAVTELVNIYESTDKVMVFLPLHHILPLLGTVVCPLYIGASSVIAPSMASEDVMKTLHENEISIIVGVPRFYDLIIKSIREKIKKSGLATNLFRLAGKINSMSFSRIIFKKVHQKFGGKLKYLVCGGAKLNYQTAKDFTTLGFEILEGYGMTEAAPMITFPRPGKVKLGSTGQAIPSLEVKLDNGQIIARGRNIMQGYYNRPLETADVLKDGWLYTGDLGKFDEDNYLFITGRTKEIIVLPNGKNINPEEIENKLNSVSDLVEESGVFLQNEQLSAVIFPNLSSSSENSGSDRLEEIFKWDVIDKYNKSVSPYKRIMKFYLIDQALPRTRLSKLKRYLLSSLAVEKAGKTFETEEPDFPEYKILKNYFEEEKEIKVYPKYHLETDIGLDSLDKVTLQVFLYSTFGVKVNEEILSEFATVERLADFIKERKTKEEIKDIDWSQILLEKINIELPKSWVTHNMFKNSARILMRVYFRIKGEGVENIPDEPCIIAPNHQSFFDGLFVAAFLKNKVMKSTYFYAKEKHVRKKWLKFIANRHNVIIMDINKDLKLSLQKLAEALRKGKNLIIFPEGTRTKTGELGSFKKTFAILSRELNVPVVPVAIKGAFDALPIGSKFPRPFKKIRVKFYQPIYPINHSYDSLKDLVHKKVAGYLN